MAEQREGISLGDNNDATLAVGALLGREIKDELVVEVYRAYLEDTHQLRAERQAIDSVRVTIVTLFLGAEAYVASTVFTDPQAHSLSSLTVTSWIPVITSVLIGFVGYLFCDNWKKLSLDFKKNLNFKYTGLEIMERDWKDQLQPIGADLFTREKEERAKARSRGVGQRVQDLQEFFKGVFVALIVGVLTPKLSVVAFIVAQSHWHVLHLW